MMDEIDKALQVFRTQANIVKILITMREAKAVTSEELVILVNPKNLDLLIYEPRTTRKEESPSSRNGVVGYIFGAKIIPRKDVPKGKVFVLPEKNLKFFHPKFNPSLRKQSKPALKFKEARKK